MLVTKVESTKPIVSLVDVKNYLNEVESDKDSEITSMINAVVEDGENITNRKFSTTTFELYLDCLEDGFKLPGNPISSIEKIEFMDENEDYQLLDSSKYYLYKEHEIGRIKLKESFKTIDHKKAIKITFTSGYEFLPESLATWIKYKVMCLYDAREENISSFIDSLIDKYRIRSI